ncbi:sigma factor-like helix-turn-helix DNA-binding protein [Microvirga calopogonii]|uniref:sigma factor-like helix-turn-helix DNA-binding protein n=1 Tax=Microvirga calopogonii TaxID=2078013 RepID=UPI000E0D39AC|nr:sigma factor-like helix-turn-helix DNA-binding protein [Microvirga calopogonii]
MTTLKEFEDALREQGMNMALAILEKLRERDRSKRSLAPARRITGRKMTPELARRILELHGTTEMTQQEIAFQLGVNQGRVNEVIKRGKWLHDDPNAPEAIARDKAKARMAGTDDRKRPERRAMKTASSSQKKSAKPKSNNQAQLLLGDL